MNSHLILANDVFAIEGMLGNGSDYTVFVHEFGIASMDSQFYDRNYGTYHSVYDSFYTMSQFIDTDFEYLRGAAQVVGLMGFEVADRDLVPFRTWNLYSRMLGFVEEINATAAAYNCSVDVDWTERLQIAIEVFGNSSFASVLRRTACALAAKFMRNGSAKGEVCIALKGGCTFVARRGTVQSVVVEFGDIELHHPIALRHASSG